MVRRRQIPNSPPQQSLRFEHAFDPSRPDSPARDHHHRCVRLGGSSDDGNGGQADGDGFCEQVVALEAASEEIEGDTIDEESLDALRSLRDAAPDEVRDDMVVLIDLFEKLAEVDESDPASAEEAIGLFFDPAVIKASQNIEAFGVSECGLEQ